MKRENMARGKLFAFEGLDGSGKSTQVQLLAEELSRRGHDVVMTREPTDGLYGQKIRQILGNRHLVTPEEELQLFMDDRRDHVQSLILPSLDAGKIVLTDRYFLSTAAYQGAQGHDPEKIMRQNEMFAPIPETIFYLDVPVADGVHRIKHGRGEIPNDFEQEQGLRQVQKVFAAIKRPYVTIIDGTAEQQAVHQQILAIVLSLIGKEG
jgi:dTMP kinase